MPDARKACLQHEAQVWIARPSALPLQELTKRYGHLLDDDECRRSQRFHFEHDRQHFIAAHSMLRLALAHYLECAPHALTFIRDHNGKPQLAQTARDSPVHFNLSHTRDMVACVLTRGHECGIDVEAIRPMKQLAGVAETVFSKEELAYLARAGGDDDARLSAFFRLWTLKEAYVKATGLGMSAPLKQISFDPDRLVLQDTSRPKHESEGWLFDSWMPATGHALALACHGCDTFGAIVYSELDLTDGSLHTIRSIEVNKTTV